MCFYIYMNLLRNRRFFNKEYAICLNCLVAFNTNFQQKQLNLANFHNSFRLS